MSLLVKGRGSQINTANPFHSTEYVKEHSEGLDEEQELHRETSYIEEMPRKVVNEVDSPDVGLERSLNPYQGCEHGCIYCYARNSHQYWGFSAGADFEQKIIVKKNAPELLRKYLDHPKYQVKPITISGNTDCYQPVEKKLQLTRQCLEILLEYKHPVTMITKNSLITRDIDILQELAKLNLVHVALSVTTLDENIRRVMEPRTASALKRFDTIAKLTAAGIPAGVMTAPIIPGLTDHEIPELLKRSAEAGAVSAGYTVVRLNGNIKVLFEDWVQKSFPERGEKILNNIRSCHGGNLNDSRFGARMRGDGQVAQTIKQLFDISKRKYFTGRTSPELDRTIFKRPAKGQLSFFE